MTIKLTRITTTLLLVVGIFIAPQVFAEVIIGSVDPDYGSPGETVSVTIDGSGFEPNAEVTMLLGKKPAPGITVLRTDDGSNSKQIAADIDIATTAELGFYSLKVSLKRGGKGTTAKATFEVRGNKVISYCHEVFEGVTSTDCDCEFTSRLDGGAGKPNNLIWILQDNCHASTTLELPQYEVLNGNGKTLTAFPPADNYNDFYSVITNSGHRTHAFNLNIEIRPDVAVGCGSGRLNSAISFVLDYSKVHPEDPVYSRDFKEPVGDTYPTTWLRAWDIIVTSTKPLCRGIELRRESGYYDKLVEGYGAGSGPYGPPSDYPDLVANVQNVLITSGSPSGAGSYSDAGIQVSGFVNSGLGGRSGEKISILFSTVEGAAAESTGSAIRFGPVDGEGTVGQNVISANGDGEFGISVEGDGMDDVTIENNTVIGAQTAISVDDKVVNAYFKSNVLTGDGLEGDPEGDPDIDIGIDTCAWNNRYRSNTINDFDTRYQEGVCDLP